MKTINNGTDGAITLDDTTLALSGDATDLAAALAGTITHTGAVTVTTDSDYTAAELLTIAGGTSGAITLNDTTVALSGSSSDLSTIFTETITTHTGAVTITTDSDYTAAELKTINNKTDGAITLNDTTVALSGDATDLA